MGYLSQLSSGVSRDRPTGELLLSSGVSRDRPTGELLLLSSREGRLK